MKSQKQNARTGRSRIGRRNNFRTKNKIMKKTRLHRGGSIGENNRVGLGSKIWGKVRNTFRKGTYKTGITSDATESFLTLMKTIFEDSNKQNLQTQLEIIRRKPFGPENFKPLLQIANPNFDKYYKYLKYSVRNRSWVTLFKDNKNKLTNKQHNKLTKIVEYFALTFHNTNNKPIAQLNTSFKEYLNSISNALANSDNVVKGCLYISLITLCVLLDILEKDELIGLQKYIGEHNNPSDFIKNIKRVNEFIFGVAHNNNDKLLYEELMTKIINKVGLMYDTYKKHKTSDQTITQTTQPIHGNEAREQRLNLEAAAAIAKKSNPPPYQAAIQLAPVAKPSVAAQAPVVKEQGPPRPKPPATVAAQVATQESTLGTGQSQPPAQQKGPVAAPQTVPKPIPAPRPENKPAQQKGLVAPVPVLVPVAEAEARPAPANLPETAANQSKTTANQPETEVNLPEVAQISSEATVNQLVSTAILPETTTSPNTTPTNLPKVSANSIVAAENQPNTEAIIPETAEHKSTTTTNPFNEIVNQPESVNKNPFRNAPTPTPTTETVTGNANAAQSTNAELTNALENTSTNVEPAPVLETVITNALENTSVNANADLASTNPFKKANGGNRNNKNKNKHKNKKHKSRKSNKLRKSKSNKNKSRKYKQSKKSKKSKSKY